MTAPHDENLRDLVQHLLNPIRRATDTPLQFEVNSAAIAEAALADYRAGESPAPLDPHDPWGAVTAALDTLILKSLDGETIPRSSESAIHADAPPGDGVVIGAEAGNAHHPLAAWLKRFFHVMRKVDHRAFEILGRRVEGLHDREIAAQLDLGLRLVKRITRDMRASWAAEIVKD